MKHSHFIWLVVVSFYVSLNVSGQNFVNLDFEDSIITSSQPFYGGFNIGMANVPGWTQNNGWGDANYPGGASLIYNNQTLDSPNVSIWDTTYPRPAIEGNYSIFLYGGSAAYAQAYPELATGASIFQTGQIPPNAKSISYWGDGLQATFNGQLLSFIDIGDAANHIIWSADISAYAGQTGELVFTAPWQSGGILDNIQFSTQPVPEPSVFAILALSGLVFGLRRSN